VRLVTKCPSCLTSFIVKPEQLEAHDGQVKCGQCQRVFVANDFLSELAVPEDVLKLEKKGMSLNKPITFLILGLLVILAVLQSLYFFRGEIARQWPALKPAIKTTCHYLGCTLPLPQHAELIAIDDTELVKDETHAGIVKFSCVIINNAPYAQSFPSIELTLTDQQDKPLTRRKIKPSEYLKGLEKSLDEGLAPNDEMRVRINLLTSDLPVTGFRAFVAY
jgi:predicted Zn finger-like uncharacterized protein